MLRQTICHDIQKISIDHFARKVATLLREMGPCLNIFSFLGLGGDLFMIILATMRFLTKENKKKKNIVQQNFPKTKMNFWYTVLINACMMYTW